MAANWDVLREQRTTDSGRECVSMAEEIFDSANMDTSAEARQWLKLGLDFDKARAVADVAEMKRLLEEKNKRSQKLSEARSRVQELRVVGAKT